MTGLYSAMVLLIVPRRRNRATAVIAGNRAVIMPPQEIVTEDIALEKKKKRASPRQLKTAVRSSATVTAQSPSLQVTVPCQHRPRGKHF